MHLKIRQPDQRNATDPENVRQFVDRLVQFTASDQMHRTIIEFVWKFLVKLGLFLVASSSFLVDDACEV